MRKIEQQMCAAIQKNINWQSGNTSVHFNEETGESIVRLHGNKIAVVSDNDMTIFDGGYQSNTTKSRLNALCDEFASLVKVFSRRIISGLFVSLLAQSTDKMFSRTKSLNLVTSSPDHLTIHSS